MRTPTTREEAWAWHRDALAGRHPPIHDEPQAGYFKRKLVRGGPWAPALIDLVQEIEDGELVADERFRCIVAGREADAADEWLFLCDHPISEGEYKYLIADGEWARLYAPADPAANPTKAIDWLTAPLPF